MLGFIAVVIFLISKYFKGFDQRRVELNYFFPLLVRRAKKPCCCKDRNFQQFQPHMSAITIYSICPDFAQTWYRLSWTALSNVWRTLTWILFCKHSLSLDQSNVPHPRTAKSRHHWRQEVLSIWFEKCLLDTAHLHE